MKTKDISPLDAMVDLIADAVAERINDPVDTSRKTKYSEDAIERVRDEIDLWKPYTAADVGAFLGLSRNRIYEFPEELLHPTWVGPNGGSKRFLGINVLMYVCGLPPVNVEAIGKRVREEFVAREARPVKVKAMPGRGKKRVH